MYHCTLYILCLYLDQQSEITNNMLYSIFHNVAFEHFNFDLILILNVRNYIGDDGKVENGKLCFRES